MNDSSLVLVPVTIEVTLDMLNNGVRKRCSECPIAKALNAKLKSKYRAMIGQIDLFIALSDGYGTIFKGELPVNVQNFVNWFDNTMLGGTFLEEDLPALAPLTFVVMIPQNYVA